MRAAILIALLTLTGNAGAEDETFEEVVNAHLYFQVGYKDGWKASADEGADMELSGHGWARICIAEASEGWLARGKNDPSFVDHLPCRPEDRKEVSFLFTEYRSGFLKACADRAVSLGWEKPLD